MHYSSQSLKNSRCEFHTMHRNRVATGTRQQDLSPFCSLPTSIFGHRTSSSAAPRPSLFLFSPRVKPSVVAFSLTTSAAVRLWSGGPPAFSTHFDGDVAGHRDCDQRREFENSMKPTFDDRHVTIK